jgi:N-acetylglucosamine kinase-like BadF-type ATPase
VFENRGAGRARQENSYRYAPLSEVNRGNSLWEAILAYSGVMKYVLGFDGGGTKTECVLMDAERNVRSQGRSGPSNPLRVGFGGSLAAVCEAGRLALQNAKVSNEQVAGLCAGLAGTGQAEAARKMKRLLGQEYPGALVEVCTDLELTLEATGDGPAIVLVAGTGSAAVGRDAEGNTVRVGGHGPLLGDEGSAYDIGKRAAIAQLRYYDRNGHTSASGAKILKELGVESWQEFQARVHAVPDELFPKIFPVVARAADEGDTEAQELLQSAATELSLLVNDLVSRLNLREQKFLLVKTGGMLQRSRYFDERLNERLRTAAPQAEFGALAVAAAEAAARIALRMVRSEVDKGKERGRA